MENAAKMDVEAYVREMHKRMEDKLRKVAEAVNAAPDGSWINASEMEVRDLFAELRAEAYEKALQMQTPDPHPRPPPPPKNQNAHRFHSPRA